MEKQRNTSVLPDWKQKMLASRDLSVSKQAGTDGYMIISANQSHAIGVNPSKRESFATFVIIKSPTSQEIEFQKSGSGHYPDFTTRGEIDNDLLARTIAYLEQQEIPLQFFSHQTGMQWDTLGNDGRIRRSKNIIPLSGHEPLQPILDNGYLPVVVTDKQLLHLQEIINTEDIQRNNQELLKTVYEQQVTENKHLINYDSRSDRYTPAQNITFNQIQDVFDQINTPKETEILHTQSPTGYVCSPLTGDIQKNIHKARSYGLFLADSGWIPFVPHATEIFDDLIPIRRKQGLSMSAAMQERSDQLWAFGFRISDGMWAEINCAAEICQPRVWVNTWTLETIPWLQLQQELDLLLPAGELPADIKRKFNKRLDAYGKTQRDKFIEATSRIPDSELSQTLRTRYEEALSEKQIEYTVESLAEENVMGKGLTEYKPKYVYEVLNTGQGLPNTYFTNMNFSSLHLQDRDFRNCYFTNCDLRGCDLSACNLNGAQFTDCQLDKTVFSKADLTASTFNNSRGVLTDFGSANLTDASFHHGIFTCPDFRRADLLSARINATSIDLPLNKGVLHFESVNIHGAGTVEESGKFRNRISDQFKLPGSVLEERRTQWARNWIANVNSGIYDKTSSYLSVEKELKSLAEPVKLIRSSSVTEAIKDHIDMLEYLEEQGFTVKRAGKQWTTKEMDSIRINPDPKHPDRFLFYRHSTGERGSVIDLSMMLNNSSRDQAIRELRQRLPNGHNSKPKQKASKNPAVPKKQFILPQRAANAKRVFAYLTLTRGINERIVSDLQKRKYLYQDSRGNVVFVGYNKNTEAALAFKRGTNSTPDYDPEKKPYKQLQEGSENIGFYVANSKTPEALVITDAAIDSLSHMTAELEAGDNPKINNYLATCGGSIEPVKYRLEQHNPKSVIIATDNDNAGNMLRGKIESLLKDNGYQGNVQHIHPVAGDLNHDLQLSKGIRPGKPKKLTSHAKQPSKNTKQKGRYMSRPLQPEGI